MRTWISGIIVWLAISSFSWADDNPRHIDLEAGLNALGTLEQNWTDQESNWFYNVPQGSRLLPYPWFLHLEQAESTKKFRDAQHIRDLGYIPRTSDALNPDGLPIGFIKDASYEDRTAGLGLNCSACHTMQIHFQGMGYVIDGGSAMGDLERFLKELAAALRSTADDDAKFQRFATSVLPGNAPDQAQASLRAVVRVVADQREGYNARNLPRQGQHRFGHGRVDAFGAIFNEVSAHFLGVPENVHPANGPVSYPCLWDAPQHDFVQWNGAAENRTSPLGQALFGTTEVGALGRNAGEVLGVFGSVEIAEHELLLPRRYSSTVNKANLIKIENSLKTLWSPPWPEETFGKLDMEAKQRGEILYKKHCVSCHAIIDRKAADRKVIAQLSDVGTDQTMIRNFGRTAKTGKLKGRRTTLLGMARLAQEEPVGVILKHVVERVILGNVEAEALTETLAAGANPPPGHQVFDQLNPGFRMSATIELEVGQLHGQLDSLKAKGETVSISGGRFQLRQKNPDPAIEAAGQIVVDLSTPAGARAATARLKGVLQPDGLEAASADSEAAPFQVALQKDKVKIGYKARPLNGIWATAPYLHNGSVPNLWELLKPANQRVKSFHVGSREYDPVHVGFVNDPQYPAFDTSAAGNANTGHEFGKNLSKEDRKDLLEFLKSL